MVVGDKVVGDVVVSVDVGDGNVWCIGFNVNGLSIGGCVVS